MLTLVFTLDLDWPGYATLTHRAIPTIANTRTIFDMAPSFQIFNLRMLKIELSFVVSSHRREREARLLWVDYFTTGEFQAIPIPPCTPR